MIDTLLANLDRFDAGGGARRSASAPRAVRRGHAPSPRQRRRRRPPPARIVAGGPRRRGALPLVDPAPSARPGDARGRRPAPPTRGSGRRAAGLRDFLSLVRGAPLVVTDSGGIQEETTILGVPCLTVRPNTERPITISQGTNRLIEPEDLGPAVADGSWRTGSARAASAPPLWDGGAGDRIGAIVAAWLDAR